MHLAGVVIITTLSFVNPVSKRFDQIHLINIPHKSISFTGDEFYGRILQAPLDLQAREGGMDYQVNPVYQAYPEVKGTPARQVHQDQQVFRVQTASRGPQG